MKRLVAIALAFAVLFAVTPSFAAGDIADTAPVPAEDISPAGVYQYACDYFCCDYTLFLCDCPAHARVFEDVPDFEVYVSPDGLYKPSALDEYEYPTDELGNLLPFFINPDGSVEPVDAARAEAFEACDHLYTGWTITSYWHCKLCAFCGNQTELAYHSLNISGIDSFKHRTFCSVCGYETVESHSLGGWQYTAGNHFKVCGSCNMAVNYAAHIFRSYDTGGVYVEECTVCGYTRSAR